MGIITEQLLQICRDQKVSSCAFVRQEDIVYDDCCLDICKSNSCGNYGKCYACPPYAESAEEMNARARSYPFGILYQTIGKIEDSFDYEGMQDAKKQHVIVSQRIHEAIRTLPVEIRHLGVGGCKICEQCTRPTGAPCRFPDRMLTAMEGFGIHVSATAKHAGLKYTNGMNTVTYFSMILYREE